MDEAAKSLPFWNDLTDAEKLLCGQSAVTRCYGAGTFLTGDCKSCLGMMHILRGEIRAYILSEEGREITLFRLGEGENCVLSAACVLSQITFETQITVTRDAEILTVPASVYGALMAGNLHVRCFSYELATKRFSAVMWVMQQILFYGYDRRLATFLLSEVEKSGRTEIRMTQEEIAGATNSAREVVARMLKQFAADGLIESKRGSVMIKDRKGLELLR